ncbi:hypothetical protein [Actinokineospora terrae]|uniref:Uncharacterized protein n=1 Tax=Actinokineospora terrae TaxID=155974 RepID=A0A1H9X029_9PSEU|nr:hypothetical protein [Actinokineospora terrae]SES39267.1 hypothetical protein SAMN04487818_11249 [Actinokineospora terrae]
MEFKTSIPFMVPAGGGGMDIYLFIAGALWMLACGTTDAMVLTWSRSAFAFAVRVGRAVRSAIAPRAGRRDAAGKSGR